MQSSENEKKRIGARSEQELSDTWKELLGNSGVAPGKPVNPGQPLSNDPWNELLNAQGMQAVDLQRVHLHNLRTRSGDDQEVEQALDLMRESTEQQQNKDEKKQ